MLERVKGGEPVVYGGLPVVSFEKLLEGDGLQAGVTDSGWKWRYAQQAQGNTEDFAGFSSWRQTVLIAEQETKRTAEKPTASERNILHEIRAFNLAGSTPIQTMSAVAEWQDFLRNGSPACAEE